MQINTLSFIFLEAPGFFTKENEGTAYIVSYQP